MTNLNKFSKAVLGKILVSAILEFGPIVIFLTSFHYLHIYKATFILMIVTIISTFATYHLQKRLPYVALYVALLTLVFGYMTILHRQPKFMQIRDTLYDVTSAVTLLTGLMINTLFLKLSFQSILPMSLRAWYRLTYLWIGFFLTIATLNEYVRRTMTLTQWFDFKSWMVVATILFGCITLYFVYEKDEQK